MGRSLFAMLSLRTRHVSYISLDLVVYSHAFIGSQLKKILNISSNRPWIRLNHKREVMWIMDFKRIVWISANVLSYVVRMHVFRTWTTGF